MQFDCVLTESEAEAIEREVMGGTKREVLQREYLQPEFTKMQEYGLRVAAERQQIEADAKNAVNEAMIKAATAMMNAKDVDFEELDRIVTGE